MMESFLEPDPDVNDLSGKKRNISEDHCSFDHRIHDQIKVNNDDEEDVDEDETDNIGKNMDSMCIFYRIHNIRLKLIL
jgi:hypothetical protein